MTLHAGETLEIVYPIRFAQIPGPEIAPKYNTSFWVVTERKVDRFTIRNESKHHDMSFEWKAVGVRAPDKGP